MPNKIEQVRSLFAKGAIIECVENTYIPKNNGAQRIVHKLGKSFADGEVLTGHHAGGKFRMAIPTRVCDVLLVEGDRATFRLDESSERLRGHTITIRRVGESESAEDLGAESR